MNSHLATMNIKFGSIRIDQSFQYSGLLKQYDCTRPWFFSIRKLNFWIQIVGMSDEITRTKSSFRFVRFTFCILCVKSKADALFLSTWDLENGAYDFYESNMIADEKLCRRVAFIFMGKPWKKFFEVKIWLIYMKLTTINRKLTIGFHEMTLCFVIL